MLARLPRVLAGHLVLLALLHVLVLGRGAPSAGAGPAPAAAARAIAAPLLLPLGPEPRGGGLLLRLRLVVQRRPAPACHLLGAWLPAHGGAAGCGLRGVSEGHAGPIRGPPVMKGGVLAPRWAPAFRGGAPSLPQARTFASRPSFMLIVAIITSTGADAAREKALAQNGELGECVASPSPAPQLLPSPLLVELVARPGSTAGGAGPAWRQPKVGLPSPGGPGPGQPA